MDIEQPDHTNHRLRDAAESISAELIEDLELSSVFDEAHEALYTVPADLARAAELGCCQQALEERPAGKLLR